MKKLGINSGVCSYSIIITDKMVRYVMMQSEGTIIIFR